MNVVVGTNHSGKSALLKALSFRFVGNPHKSSAYRRDQPLNPVSTTEIELMVSGQEASDALLGSSFSGHIPIPLSWSTETATSQLLDRFFGLSEITFSLRADAQVGAGVSWSNAHFPSNNMFSETRPDTAMFLHVSSKKDRSGFIVHQAAPGANDTIGAAVANVLTSRTYFFDAQRVPQSNYRFGSSTQLNSSADNLAEVLNVLQSNRAEFAEFVSLVSRVIPAIKWISLVPSSQQLGSVEIRIWNVEDHTRRDDLAIPLAECGTGVGQVLSLLYVVLKSQGSIVVIDEPNSFLHPRAAKALISILKEDASNQYIISTHSPEIISSCDPDRFLSLRFSNERTEVTEIARSDLVSTKQVLNEIGSQLSDIFGADAVLWVEGPTEVECFPELLRVGGVKVGAGLAIAPLRSTGDFVGKHGEAIADIYRNLSSVHAVLPTTLAVSLDGDQKRMVVDQKRNLEHAFGTQVHFIDRRCYENYLIHPDAIVAVLNSMPSFAGAAVNSAQVTKWLMENGQDAQFRASAHSVLSKDWLVEVDAAKLLNALFQDLSSSRDIFRKPLHSVSLTKWLIANDAAFLSELIDYVCNLVPKK